MWQVQAIVVGLSILIVNSVCAKPCPLIEDNPMQQAERSMLEAVRVDCPMTHISPRKLKDIAIAGTASKKTATRGNQIRVVSKATESAKIKITVEKAPKLSATAGLTTASKNPPKQVQPAQAAAANAAKVVEKAGTKNPTMRPATGAENTDPSKLVLKIGKPRKPKATSWPHSVALGKPFGGYLYNPVQLKNSERVAVRKHKNYATAETVTAIETAVNAVHEVFPNTPRLPIGNLSRKAGGKFRPHKSHQNGRDADIAYFLKAQHHHPKYLKLANAETIDAGRTWIFLESMIRRGELQLAFIDYRLQGAMYKYATQKRGWTKAQMNRIMSYPNGRGKKTTLIRHLRGHADHMHLRFYAPDSIAAVDELISRYGTKILKPVPLYTRVRSGDSLWKIAKRHRSTVKQLQKWNGGKKKTRILRPGQRLIIGFRRPSISDLKGSI